MFTFDPKAGKLVDGSNDGILKSLLRIQLSFCLPLLRRKKKVKVLRTQQNTGSPVQENENQYYCGHAKALSPQPVDIEVPRI